MDPITSNSKIEKLKENLNMLYKDYQTRYWTRSLDVSATPIPHELDTESPLENDLDNVSISIQYYNFINNLENKFKK